MTERRESAPSKNVTRGRRRGLARDLAFTLLFAVVAAVSAAALVRTVARPFETGSYGIAQWALFAATVVGSALGFVRSMRFYASLSLLARARVARSDAATESEDAMAAPQRWMHPVLDDLSWAAIALAVAALNALAVWAVLATLEAPVRRQRPPDGLACVAAGAADRGADHAAALRGCGRRRAA